jgi:hypothetical protein
MTNQSNNYACNLQENIAAYDTVFLSAISEDKRTFIELEHLVTVFIKTRLWSLS